MSPAKDERGAELGASTPKIAIKGFSLSSKSGAKPGAQPLQSTLGKRPRSTFGAAEESDSEGENGNGRGNGRHEAVVAFGDGRAIKVEEKKKEPLVIKRVGNRDWKAEARGRVRGGKKNLLPEEVQALRRKKDEGEEKKVEGVDVVNGSDGEIKWGLSVRKRPEPVPEPEPAMENVTEEKEKEVVDEEEKPREMTADEEALAALTGAQKERKGPEMIIRAEPLTEEEAYRRSVAAAPDPSTLEDYERVPVEEFGAALLRGMGWNGEEKGRVRDVKRRQNLLGLGARELKDAEELGAWVGKSDVKRLNGGDRGGRGGRGGGERRPRVNEFLAEKEKRDQKREERGGGSYRREKDRDRDSGRDSGRDRDGYRERDRERDRR
ncbi:hypothetical protein NA56DRAFT_558703, partial [Hyaloscypha hepaticicola]